VHKGTASRVLCAGDLKQLKPVPNPRYGDSGSWSQCQIHGMVTVVAEASAKSTLWWQW
jgi:hypothetical protein